MLNNAICSNKAEIKCMATHLDRVCLRKKPKQEAIYFMSTLERRSARKKAPKPTESVEEAALKASGPMPCALLIVTSAFLSSNSDWWVHQGGGVFFRGERECLVVKNSVFKSHLSCQRADTGHPGTRGLCCTECGHWPSFSPTPTPTTTSHLQNTPQPPHLICSLLSSWPQWTAMLLPLLTPPLQTSTTSCACVPLFTFSTIYE